MKFLKKKGFTLVELVVVIAIIGVLAAILVPTLLGYTLKASVTAANSTAANLRKAINNYLLELNIADSGMKRSRTDFTYGTITVTGGVWTLTIDDTSLFLTSGRTWTGTGSASAGDSVLASASAETVMALKLADMFPEIETAYIQFNLYDATCNALYITTETNQPFTMPSFVMDGWSSETYLWNNADAGISREGYAVGTSPVLQLG